MPGSARLNSAIAASASFSLPGSQAKAVPTPTSRQAATRPDMSLPIMLLSPTVPRLNLEGRPIYRAAMAMNSGFCRVCESAAAPLQRELAPDRLGAFERRGLARIDRKVIGHIPVNAVILPARQPDQAIPALPLALFQHVQRREDANMKNLERRQKFLIFPALLRLQQDLVDDQVVALSGQGGDGLAHAPQRPLRRRPAGDDDGRLAVLLDGL